MAYIKADKTNHWEARWRRNGKFVYKSTRIKVDCGDPEQNERNKAHAQRIANVFHAAARKDYTRKELHRVLDEIIDEAL